MEQVLEKPWDLRTKIQDLMRMSLGYVAVCLVRDELDIKYYVSLWENELKKEYIMVGTTIQAAVIQR